MMDHAEEVLGPQNKEDYGAGARASAPRLLPPPDTGPLLGGAEREALARELGGWRRSGEGPLGRLLGSLLGR